MPKRVYLLGVGVALVALGLVLTDELLSLGPGVTQANVERIRAGMTREEVTAILRAPSGSLLDGGSVWWVGERGAAIVSFEQGLAAEAMFFPREHETTRMLRNLSPRESPGPYQRLRSWLGSRA